MNSPVDQFIQHDGYVWRVLSTGAERDGSTYCHLIAEHQRQRDGKTPVQIADWVPNRILARARSN